MSSFTERLIVMAVPTPPSRWARAVPPGLQRPRWQVIGGFRYCVGSLERPVSVIDVPDGYVFDGASVPLPFRLILPMAHPDYMQAAALHDWMTELGIYPRRFCDDVFCEALGVLGLPRVWRAAMYFGVRIGAIRWHLRRIAEGKTWDAGGKVS